MPKAARLAGAGRKGRRRGPPKKGFSIGKAFSSAWEHFKADRNFLKYGLILLLLELLNFGASIWGDVARENRELGWAFTLLLFRFISAAAKAFFYYRLLLLVLRTVAGKKSRWKKLATGWRGFGRYLGTNIMVFLAVLIGFLMLIVPGVIASLAFMFAIYATLEYRTKAWQALKISWALTKGVRVRLFTFSFACLGVSLLGVLCLLVGAVVTTPLVYLAMVEVYRQLERQTDLRAVLKAA